MKLESITGSAIKQQKRNFDSKVRINLIDSANKKDISDTLKNEDDLEQQDNSMQMKIVINQNKNLIPSNITQQIPFNLKKQKPLQVQNVENPNKFIRGNI